MRPVFGEHVPSLFKVVCSISTTIRITVLVMGYFKVWTGENIFHVEFSECVFFFCLSPENMTVIETEKEELFQQYLILYTERS